MYMYMYVHACTIMYTYYIPINFKVSISCSGFFVVDLILLAIYTDSLHISFFMQIIVEREDLRV